MKNVQKIDLGLTGYDELFANDEERKVNKLPRIFDIPISEIDDFPDHPFKVKIDEDMDQLVQSIKERGIITPVTLRPKEDGRYEIVSGHRRKKACEIAGLDTVKAEVREMSRDEAIILMVESNLQRSTILPSEKAFSYKMRLEAMKRQAGRPAQDNYSPVGNNSLGTKSSEIMADEVGESRNTIFRYIRLTELIPPLLDLVDEGRIAFRPAVELSYLKKEEQEDLLEEISYADATPSLAQAIKMKRFSQEGKLSNEVIESIMSEEKPNQKEKIRIKYEDARRFIPDSVPYNKTGEYIMKALEYCYELHIIVHKPASIKKVSVFLREDVTKLDQYIAQADFLGRTGITTIVVLSGTSYYEALESAMKIRKFVKQRNVSQLPKSMQDIIRDQQDEAGRYELSAMEDLKKAIVNAAFYVDGEHVEIKSGDAKSRIDQALEYLVAHVYSELGLIEKNAETDADIIEILTGNFIAGAEPNRDAAAKVEEYLIVQDRTKLPTSMFDVQSRYQGIPYGWREIDIAAVVALLINQQKVTIKYGGATIQPNDPKLPDMLRKKSEIGKTSISKRQVVTAVKMKAVKDLLREYFDVMDVPDDEDGLVAFIVMKFEAQKAHYEALEQRYVPNRRYPDKGKVQAAIQLATEVLSQKKDNIALIDRVLKLEDKLFDNKEDLQEVESFFKTQVQVFDAAAQMEEDLRNELDYLSHEPEANDALNKIRLIVVVQGGFSYKKIPELNGLMATVREGHDRLLASKREEVSDIITQCMGAVHQAANGDFKAKDLVSKADEYYSQQRQKVKDFQSLALLDGLIPPMLQYKDTAVARIEVAVAPPKPVDPPKPPVNPVNPPKPAPKKVIRSYNRSVIFPAKTMETPEEVDDYVEKLRSQLKQLLKNCDGIQLK